MSISFAMLEIMEVEEADDLIVVALQDKNPDAGGQLKLFLTTKPDLELKAWSTKDAQGIETRVELSNLGKPSNWTLKCSRSRLSAGKSDGRSNALHDRDASERGAENFDTEVRDLGVLRGARRIAPQDRTPPTTTLDVCLLGTQPVCFHRRLRQMTTLYRGFPRTSYFDYRWSALNASLFMQRSKPLRHAQR